jgi:hypothetical protein
MERIPNDDDAAEAWLNAIFPIRREWDGLTLNQMFPAKAEART